MSLTVSLPAGLIHTQMVILVRFFAKRLHFTILDFQNGPGVFLVHWSKSKEQSQEPKKMGQC